MAGQGSSDNSMSISSVKLDLLNIQSRKLRSLAKDFTDERRKRGGFEMISCFHVFLFIL